MQSDEELAFGVPRSTIVAQLERVRVARQRLRSEESQLPWLGRGGPDYYLRFHEIALQRALRNAGVAHATYVARYGLVFGFICAGCFLALWAGASDLMYLPRRLLSDIDLVGRVLVLAAVSAVLGWWIAESQWRRDTANLRAALDYGSPEEVIN